jgi:UDP-3-O-[3-hydroxymyristoyl] glucosamine N-acyltransferase
MKVSFTQADVAAIVAPLRTAGSTTEVIRGIASLGSAKEGDLSFLGNPKYKTAVPSTRASIVLLPPDYAGEPGANQLHMFVDNPSVALARLCSRVEQALWPKPVPGIHPTAFVAPDATVATSATVGPQCVIEPGARIGEGTHLQAQVFVGRGSSVGRDSWLMAGVVICAECTLGERVRLHPGVVVGADGFGYEFVKGRHEKVPQVGTVVIGDDVEIGSNSTIDRSRFEKTVVGEGTKIDNLVQVGHNVVIGKHCLICAQVGIAGSVTMQDFVVVGGQVGIVGHLTIGTGAMIAAQSGVKDDIPAKTSVWGSPARPVLLEQKVWALRNRLPELFKRVDALELGAGITPARKML